MSETTIIFSEQEIRDAIDQSALLRYNMSGETFINSVLRCEEPDPCGGSSDLAALIDLLPEGQGNLV